ncbi:MAG: S8 family serine peptidase [Planctomycetes bacterium]|nr:S8 family serine peptidase [Planctomycetota bacterium]
MRQRSTRSHFPGSAPALGALALLLGLTAGLPASSSSSQGERAPFEPAAKQDTRDGTPERARAFLVDVGARLILPRADIEPRFDGERALVYVQFGATPERAEITRLTRSGVRFLEPLNGTTYLARIRRDAVGVLRATPGWRGFENVEPEDKLHAQIFLDDARSPRRDIDGTWSAYVRFQRDATFGRALSVLDQSGAFTPDRTRFLVGHKLLVQGNARLLRALAADSAVRYIEPVPGPDRTFNQNAAALSNIDDIQGAPWNLSGAGLLLGEWDGGNVQTDHPDLTGRVTLIEDTSVSDHATHVAGTMIGDGTGGAAVRGMAPQALLVSANFTAGDSADEQDTIFGGSLMILTNNSWGTIVGWNTDSGGTTTQTGNQDLFGAYDGQARDFDEVVRTHRRPIVKSAGNDRNDCDPSDSTDCDGVLGPDGQRYDTIPTWGNSKNVITVAATNDNGTIAAFSSSGPSDDGRVKPDVAANGVTLISTCEGSTYCSKSGTSMAAPTVSGLVALLTERYAQVFGVNPTADIVKALLVNTAIEAGRPGPDFLFGHGIVDGLAAVQTIDAGFVRILTEAVDQGQLDEFLLMVPGGTPELRVTLNWIDREGAANSVNPDIRNNLNLELVSPTNQIFRPFLAPASVTADAETGVNLLDTVEHARVTAPLQGFWRVRVRGASVPDGPQSYALVANQSFWLPSQPNISVSAALDFDELCEGEFQDKVVSVFNTGGAPLLVHSVAVTAGAPAFALSPNPTQPIYIHPGAHVDFIVRFDPTGPGPFTGNLQIFSNDADTPIVDLAMTGEGCPPPDIALSGSSDFGQVCVGVLAEKTIWICNTGVDDLVISTASFGACQEFQVVETTLFPAWVPGGHCLPLVVRYTPQGAGSHNCVLSIASNDPDEALLAVIFTGETPVGQLDVIPPSCFPPTVIQSVDDACSSEQQLVITNTGVCPIYVKDVSITAPGAHFADFELVNLPTMPIWLLPGESVGDGILLVRFKPRQVERFVTGTLNVQYQTDQGVLGADTTLNFPLVGEGVKTGARVLITNNGVPVPLAERITLFRIIAPYPLQLEHIQTNNNVPLFTEPGLPPCPGFDFSREWGAATNPNILLVPGEYLIEARVFANGQNHLLKQRFTVGICDFIPDVEMGI